jgi:hypothetical protein
MLDAMTSLRRGISRLDVLIAVLAVGLSVVLMLEDHADEGASLLALPLFLPIPLTLLWRRAAPLHALAAALVAVTVHVAVFGNITRCGAFLPISFLLVFTPAARLPLRGALQGLGLYLVATTVMLGWDRSAGIGALPYACSLAAVVFASGRLVHARGIKVARLQEHTAALRTARDDRARMEVAMDRARLSAELDELLQRRLGELATLADRGLAGEDGAAATATLLDIERGSRRTLEEMRAVVGVLRSDAQIDPVAPQPTLTHLEAMLVRAKGADARLTVEGNPRVLPAGVELSAYRVVEHLLDALEDAPDVTVVITFGDDALDIAVAGPAARRGQAAGAIERARERVALHAGTLDAATRGGRAEAVAHLPFLAVA